MIIMSASVHYDSLYIGTVERRKPTIILCSTSTQVFWFISWAFLATPPLSCIYRTLSIQSIQYYLLSIIQPRTFNRTKACLSTMLIFNPTRKGSPQPPYLSLFQHPLLNRHHLLHHHPPHLRPNKQLLLLRNRLLATHPIKRLRIPLRILLAIKRHLIDNIKVQRWRRRPEDCERIVERRVRCFVV
jgi:hypothetical protein